MMRNLVAKHARKFNRSAVFRDKTKQRVPKKLTANEIGEYYDEEKRDTDTTDDLCEKVNG